MREQPDTWPIIFLLIRMQGWLKGSMFAQDDYGYENFRIKIKEAYDEGFETAEGLLNNIGIPELTLQMEIVAREAYDKCIELNSLICDGSPILQKEVEQMRENIDIGELIYFGDIVANPKPLWYKG